MLSSFILTVIMNNNISNSSVSGQRNLSQRDLPDTNYRAICITRCAIPRDAKWQSPALRGDKSSIATLMPTAQDSKKSSGLILLLNCTEIWFCHSNKQNFRTHVFESNKKVHLKIKAILLKCLKDIYHHIKIYSGIVQYGWNVFKKKLQQQFNNTLIFNYLLEISFSIWFKAYEIKLYFNCSFYWKSDYNYNHSKSFEWIRIKDFTHFFFIYNGFVCTTCTSSIL